MGYLNKDMILPDEIVEEEIVKENKDIFPITEDYIFEDAQYNDVQKYPIFIVLMHSGTPLANAIKTVTHSQYSHACISFNAELDPIYSFGEKTRKVGFGFVTQNIKDNFYKKQKTEYGVYVMFVSKEARDSMKQELEYFKKNQDKMKYDCFGLFQVFFNQSTDYKKNKYFCSRFVMDIIQSGIGIQNDKSASLWKPEDIKQLGNISLVSYGKDVYRYSRSKTLATMKSMFGYKPVNEGLDIVKTNIDKYMKSHPALNKIVSLTEQDEELYYRVNPVIAKVNIRDRSDITKVNSLLEYCNKLGFKIESSPMQENIESSVYIIQ